MDAFAQRNEASVSLVLDAQGLVHTEKELLFSYNCPPPSGGTEELSGLQLWPQVFCSSNVSQSHADCTWMRYAHDPYCV